MIVASIAPVSPPTAGLAGLFDTRSAGVSSARMSSKSPSLFTLCGANSVMSSSPAQSSRCLISSQLRAVARHRAPAIPAAGPHEHPRALQLVSVQRELQVALLQRRIDIVDFRRPGARDPRASRCPRRSLRGSRLRTRRSRADDPRRAWPAAWSSDRATGPSAPPTRAARRCVRAGSRSAGGWRDASGRRRSARAPSSGRPCRPAPASS